MPKLSLYWQIKNGDLIVTQCSPMEWRFWKRVDKEGLIHPVYGQCWRWTGHKMKSGYGSFTAGLAHRYSWLLHCGEVPEGLSVLHHCDNRECVNPGHLFLGTQQDNLADMRSKGHQVRGETQGGSKLTDGQVREIRSRYKRYSHKHGSGALAREFGIGEVEIWRIVKRQRWAHVI